MESQAGPPAPLDAERLAELQRFLEEAESQLSEAEQQHGHGFGLSGDGRFLFYGAVPVFLVDDIEATCGYYSSVLGFNVNFTYADPATFACVSRNNVMINFNLARPVGARNSVAAAGCEGDASDAYLLVTHVDDLYEELRGRGARIVSAPVSRDYGMRECVIEDCNGYRLTLADGVIGG